MAGVRPNGCDITGRHVTGPATAARHASAPVAPGSSRKERSPGARVAVVSVASHGLGQRMAWSLARRGMRVDHVGLWFRT